LSVKQLASIALSGQKELMITVWDKNAVGPVTSGIEKANIGLSLKSDGNVIRAVLPPLSAERREELQKIVKRMAEETRIHLRTMRDEVLKKIRAAGEQGGLTEDGIFKTKEEIQKKVEEGNKKIEAAVEAKIKELGE
jgi:ribosome recycling factor